MEIDLNQISPQPIAEPTIDLTQAQPKEQLTEEAQEARSKRYGFLKELLNTDEDTIKYRIKNGDEEGVRLDVATALEAREMQRRERSLADVAKARGRSLTPQEFNAIVENPPTFDPLIAPESEYAKHYLKVLDDSESALSKAVAQASPEEQAEAKRVLDIEHRHITQQAYLQRWKEKVKSAYDKQSWPGWIVDQAKSLVPGHTDYYMRGTVPGTSMLGSGVSRSENYLEQRRALFRLSDADFATTVDNTLNNYMATNPTLALEWINAMEGLSANENFLANAGIALDYFGLPGVSSLGKAAGRGVRAMMGKAAADVAKAAADNGADRAAMHAAAGRVDDAAVSKAADQIVRNLKGPEYVVSKDSLDKLPSALRVDQRDFLANPPTRMAEHLVDRITNIFNKGAENLTKAIGDKVGVSRTPILQAAEEVVREKIAQAMIDKHISISDQMFDISKPIYDQATTTLSVDIKFGDSTGRLFTSPLIAQRFIREHGLLSAKVEQQGSRWYVSLNQPVNETDNWVKDLIGKTALTKNPDSMLNAFVGAYRNPDDILTKSNRLERKLATFGQSNLLAAAQELAKSFKDLKKGVVSRDIGGSIAESRGRFSKDNRQRWEQFQRTLEANRRMENPNTLDGVPGYMFKDTNELDNFYMNNFQRLPDPVEVEAYFAFKTITEMDRQVRNLLVLRNMLRNGAEKHRIHIRDTQAVKIHQNTFNGIKRNYLPGSNDTVAIMGNTLDKLQVANAANLQKKSTKFFKQLNEDIKAGRKIAIELWDPEQMPFENIPGLHDVMPKWVVLDKVDTMALDFEQVPRRFGGHFEYAYEQYLKQAKVIQEKVGGITRARYLGDTTIMPVAFKALGKDAAEILNNIRIALKNKDEALAEDIFNKMAPVGLSWREVHQWFKPTVRGDIRKPAMLNLNEPIMVVDRNVKIADINKNEISNRYLDKAGNSTFIDETTSGSPARRMQVAYTSERDARDLYTLTNKGTRDNPLYHYEPAKFVDPLKSMDKAYTQLASSSFMDDYKIKSIESWIEEALPHLNANEAQVRSAPFHFFHNADEYYAKGADPVALRNLKNSKWQIDQFLGVRTWQDNVLHSAASKIADSMYSKGWAPIDPVWLMPKLKDPFRFLRGMAFHMKLGMFAVPQLLVQGQSWVTIAALGGVGKAATAVPASWFSRAAMLNSNKEILDHMDKMASKFGWKPGEWAESNAALMRTGFHNVGREVAVRDDHLGPSIVKTDWGNFLDWGAIFFTEGERFSRLGAWHVAYKEFRQANPLGRLTDDNIKEILARADDLTVNMSRASSSALHQGVMSLPTQFLSYQIRLAELMWGKRISMKDKARILTFQSMAYGLPIVPGVMGLPMTDWIRGKALEHGYVVGDSWISSVMEGLPATALALLSGEGDIQKGNWYNIQDRFGPQGFETLRDITRIDKTMWEVLGGPALSTANGLWNAAVDPMLEFAMSGIREDQKLVKFGPDQIMDIFKEISSINTAWRSFAAINTGRWMSKNEQYLADASASSAIFMGLTGLQPQSVTDSFIKGTFLKDKRKFEDEMEKLFIKDYRRGLELAATDPASAQEKFNRAFAIMSAHIPEERKLGIMAKAYQGHESLEKRIDKSFYLRNLAPGTHNEKLDAYERKLKLQEKGLR